MPTSRLWNERHHSAPMVRSRAGSPLALRSDPALPDFGDVTRHTKGRSPARSGNQGPNGASPGPFRGKSKPGSAPRGGARNPLWTGLFSALGPRRERLEQSSDQSNEQNYQSAWTWDICSHLIADEMLTMS